MRILLLSLILTFTGTSISSADEVCATSFDDAVEQHLTALDNRDLNSYLGTLPERQKQLVILPDGTTWSTLEEITLAHQQWFLDETWVFNRKLRHRSLTANWGIAVYEVSVDRPDSPGEPFLLSLMFSPEEDGCWYLQHDQNTLIVNPAESNSEDGPD